VADGNSFEFMETYSFNERVKNFSTRISDTLILNKQKMDKKATVIHNYFFHISSVKLQLCYVWVHFQYQILAARKGIFGHNMLNEKASIRVGLQ
jgi:hypothetical protein